MTNMSYCRFQNTSGDLDDCVENFWTVLRKDTYNGLREHQARQAMLEQAMDLVQEALDRLGFDELSDLYDAISYGKVDLNTVCDEQECDYCGEPTGDSDVCVCATCREEEDD